MREVIDLRTGRGHDGRVGNGGAVVAADSARAAGGDADYEQLAGGGKNRGRDGDEDAEGAPGGAGRESEDAGHDEDDRGQQAVKSAGSAVHEVTDEFRRAEIAGHGLEGDCEGQNDDRRNHGDEALGDAGHRVLEADDTARDKVDNDENEGDYAAPGKADKGVGVAESADEVARKFGAAGGICAEEAAYIEHAYGAGDYQDEHGEHEVDNAALGVCGFILAAGKATEIAVELGAHLVDAHGAVVELHAGQGHDEHESQQRVEVIGYRLDEQLDAAVARVEVCRDAGDGGCPGGDRGYHADGRGGRVDEICELGAGDAVSISHRPHDRADGQAVEIVVNEDQNAEDEGREYRAYAGLDVGLCPAAERRRATGHIDQCYDYAKQDEEEKDARVVRNGGDEAVIQCGVESTDG